MLESLREMLQSTALSELLTDPQDQLPALGMGYPEHLDHQFLQMPAGSEGISELSPAPPPTPASEFLMHKMVCKIKWWLFYTIKE